MNSMFKRSKSAILGAGVLLALAMLLLWGTAQVAHAQAPPRIGISSQDDVTEGQSAVFTVSIARAPSSDLQIPVTVHEYPPQGSVAAIGQIGARVVTIPSGFKMGTLNVATDDDSVAEPRGMITAVLDAPTLRSEYALDRTATYSTVVVSDNDFSTPEVTVVPWLGSDFDESSEQVNFKIVANPKPQDEISVNLNIVTTGDYGIQTGAHTVVVPTVNNGSILFSLPFTNDLVNEPDGVVTATIQAGTDYVVGSPAISTVIIIDDDDPKVSIFGGSAVTEGEAVTFSLAASPLPYQPVSVNINVAPSSDVTGVTPGVQTVILPTSGSTTFTISTTDNSYYAPFDDGSITVSVQDGSDYDVGWSSSASVEVRDNDGPVITIAPVSDVMEGTNASFTFTSNPPVSNGVSVNLAIVATGDYGVNAGSKSVYIPSSGSRIYSIGTIDDTFDEPDGMVKVTIITGRSYRVGDPSSATVNVADDEVTASSDPVLTISAGPDVIEGEDASFTITATPAISVGQTISVFMGSKAPGVLSVPWTETMTGATHTFTHITDDNDRDDHDGIVSVFIRPGTGYTLGDPYNASLTVFDNDLAKVGLYAPRYNWIDEDGSARFRVFVNPSSDNDLTISVAVTSTGDFGIPAHTKQLSIPARKFDATFTITPVPDQVHETDGSFTVTVQPSSTIEVVGLASQTITVRDDDPVPGPSIRIDGPTNKAKAGGKAEFVISLTEASADTVSVDYKIETFAQHLYPESDFHDGNGHVDGTILFTPGDRQAILDVHIDPWAPVEHNDRIYVNLSNPVNASLFWMGSFATGRLTNK